MRSIRNLLTAFFTIVVLALSPAAFAQSEAKAGDVSEATAVVAPDVQNETSSQAQERRKKILTEATEALAKTKDALQALEEERVDDALDALAMTTGKLELIVAREPELALAATDVTIATHDLYASPEAIRKGIDKASDALRNGEVQKARRILGAMGSEVIITVSSLPLATYPQAIKAITPLIDQGEYDQAKHQLQAALNTLVLIDHVVPLPVVRSEALLKRSQILAEKTDRNAEENEELANQLSAIRDQLEMAELLGYGDKKDYKQLYSQLDQIEKNTANGKSEDSIFESVKEAMAKLMS